MLNENIILKDEFVTLKPLHTCEISFSHIAEIANDYSISKYVGHGFPFPYDVENAKSFSVYTKDAWEKGSEYCFAILVNDEYIGNIGIKLDKENNIIKNIGYWLGKKYEGNGYMTRAAKLIVNFCFDELEVRKIEAGVYEGNVGSMKVLEKNGFVKEGIKIKHYMAKDGSILDTYIFGLIKN